MPVYVYWGEDDFAIQKAVAVLKRIVDPQWEVFNYTVFPPDGDDAVTAGLNEAMTPAFGCGGRLVWLVDTTLSQHCSEDLLTQLQRSLPVIPDNVVLLLTSRTKLDGRLKSSQLLRQHADIREFSLIPPWKTHELVQRVQQAAQEVGVKLTKPGAELLAECVGNNTRQLYTELEKLSVATGNQPVNEDVVRSLVSANTASSLQLGTAIVAGDASKALALVSELIGRNEPSLRIVATLVGQFRTWLWVKILMDAGERDKSAIASAARIGNPNRVHFLQQEVKPLKVHQLVATLPKLLQLEVSLKQGAEEITTLQTKIIELCLLF